MKTFAIVTSAASLLMAGSLLTADPVLITGIEDDFVDSPAATIGTGDPGEWTRFGTSLDEMAITTQAAEVDEGDQALYMVAVWNSWGFGVEYVIPDGPIDMSGAASGLSYRAMQTEPGSATIRIRVAEADGDVWVGTQNVPGTSYETFSEDLASSLTIDDASGDGTLDLSQVVSIGFVALASGQTETTVFFIDEIYHNVDLSGPEPADPPTGAGVGEWTRFGAAYNGISIVDNAAGATDGDHYLSVLAAFDTGSAAHLVGARHEPYDSDWSAYDTISFDVRANKILADTSVQVAIFEADGDIWVASVTNPFSAAEEYTNVTFSYDDFNLDTAGSGSDETLTGDDVIIWGFNFFNNQVTDTQNFRVDNVVLSADSSVADWLLHN